MTNTEGRKVLITTSGLGSRLGDLTKFTNKSLVRIGDKPAISHIIDSYPEDTSFVITLGHYGDHVRQFLNLCYKDRSFEFVDVDDYAGPKSSLLYSISLCESLLQQPFVFHACDSLVGAEYYDNLQDFSSNWIIGCMSEASHHYRTFNVRQKNVVRINEKGEQSFDFAYVGIAGIYEYKKFWELTRLCLNDRSNDLSDCHVINMMIESASKFACREIKVWLDIGNVDSLKIARSKLPSSFHVLDKSDESIYIFDDYVYKFFYDAEICKNRVKRFTHLEGLVPELISSSKNFYKYRYVQGDLLADHVNLTKFEDLLSWSSRSLWKKLDNPDHKSNCLKFYRDKTIQRVDRFLQKYNMSDTEDNINGIIVPKMSELIQKIDFDSLSHETSTGFHGDFILDNILLVDGGFKLIDWRQDFNGDVKHGDMIYDLAKLNHNLIVNHGMVKDEQFSILFDDDGIKCDINVKKSLIDCQRLLVDFCQKSSIDYKKVDMLTSIIWINMAPLHEHPLDVFLYYFGKYNLFLRLRG